MQSRLIVALLLALTGAGTSAATLVDIYGRPIVGPDGKTYYADATSASAVRTGDRWSKTAAPRYQPTPRNIVPPTGFPVFSGHGENFAFYPYIAYAVGSWPNSVAIADVNGDGRNDVILATTFYFDATNDYHIFVFIQDADGSLLPPISYAYAGRPSTAGLVTGHFTRGAGADVIVGSNSGVDLFASVGGGLATGVYYLGYLGHGSQLLTSLDVDLDGAMDLVGLDQTGNGGTIYSNNGNGAFAATAPLGNNLNGFGSLFASDLDGDGLDDLVVAYGATINVLWHNGDPDIPGSGTLSMPTTIPTVSAAANYTAAGDINHDGRVDLLATRPGNSPTWLLHFDNTGSRQFAAGQAYPSYDIPQTILSRDINLDGRDDIMVLHGGWNAAGLYLQASDGGMGVEQLFQLPYASQYQAQGLALGDINGDGCTDAVIADYNNGLILLYGHDCSDEIFGSNFE